MATRRTQSGPRKGARPGHAPGNIRPGARGGDRARTTTAATARPRFTNRMAILVVVLAVLVISYASSMRAYLEQRAHINDLRAEIVSSQRDIKALEREKRRWQDDAYVEAQARERFGWMMPGETGYQVIDRDGKPLERRDELTDPDSVARQVPDPWWDKVNGTLEAADHPKKAATPQTSIAPDPSSTPTPDP
jgi:cell division protein FtsB